MKKILIIILILIGTINCNSHKDKKKDLKYSNLNVIGNVRLQENEDVILSTISNISLNSDATKMLVSDNRGRTVTLYNFKNGEIIKNFTYGIDYSDSLGKKSYPWDDGFEFVRNKKVVDKNGDPVNNKFLKKYLTNEVNNGIFISDSIVCITVNMNCFKKSMYENFDIYNILIALTAVIILENIYTGETELIHYQNKYHAFAQCYSILYDTSNRKFISMCTNTPAEESKKWDSLWILCSYHRDGKLDSLLFTLPKEYQNTKLGYMFYYPKTIFDNNLNLLCVLPISEKIYNLTINDTICLKDLPESNYDQLNRIAEDFSVAEKYLDKNLCFLPNYINNIFVSKSNNYLVWVNHAKLTTDTIMPNFEIIQEYRSTGDLVRQYAVEHENEKGVLHFMDYDPVNNHFLAFRKSNKYGWTLQILDDL
jgi:hypothetical protein